MSDEIKNQAREEIIRHVSNELLKELLPDTRAISDRITHLTVNQVAGRLDVHPDTVRKHFREELVNFGGRQDRIPLARIDVVLDQIREKQKKARKSEKTKRAE